jgi:hypothetical protein
MDLPSDTTGPTTPVTNDQVATDLVETPARALLVVESAGGSDFQRRQAVLGALAFWTRSSGASLNCRMTNERFARRHPKLSRD